MPPGQPTLYRPEYCEQLLIHMSEGLSFESFGGVIGVGRSTLYGWVDVHPQFSDAKNIGTEAGLLWWETKGRDCLHEKNFRDAPYIFTMKARFKWAEQLVLRDNKDEESERERIRKLPMAELVKLIKENPPEEIE